MANPDKSAYGFGLDKTKAGQFVVSFRVNQHSEIQSWVRSAVTPALGNDADFPPPRSRSRSSPAPSPFSARTTET